MKLIFVPKFLLILILLDTMLKGSHTFISAITSGRMTREANSRQKIDTNLKSLFDRSDEKSRNEKEDNRGIKNMS